MQKRLVQLLLIAGLAACSQPWNDPYPAADAESNILYAAFTDRPKHLDPAQSYTEDEITFTAQIYEPPLQYHYLKRPYELIPGTVKQVPQPRFLNAQGREVPADAPVDAISESVYELTLLPGIHYQPHPAFAVDVAGQPLYLGKGIAAGRQTVGDFSQTGSRELTADDYIYQIKRLALPRVRALREGLRPDQIVVGCGGIMGAQDAREYLAAGAALVECYTGWIYGGPGWEERLASELGGGT